MSFSFTPMMYGSEADLAPAVRPQLNCFKILDAMTGSYLDGLEDEKILNGGLMSVVALGGEGNTSKTTILLGCNLSILSRHPSATLTLYDTEGNFSPNRIVTLASRYPNLEQEDWYTGNGRFRLMSAIELHGDQWFERLKDFGKMKEKEKKQWGTTPFLDTTVKDKKVPMKFCYPTLSMIDSISEFQSQEIRKKVGENEIDDKELNTMYMADALQKAKMIGEMAKLLPRSGQFVTMTAHVDDTVNLGVTPERKKLIFMRQGQKFKRVPKNFSFLTQHCWEIKEARPLLNSAKDGPLYPSKQVTDSDAKMDMMAITFQGVRNKSGPSGLPVTVVVSQSTGLLMGLSYYHHLVSSNYGMEQKGHSYTYAFYPQETLQRTTIRDKIDSDPLLERALELGVEIAIMVQYRNEWPNKYRLKLSEIYEKVTSQGIDWNTILSTRGYWLFKEEEEGLKAPPYLSAMDLCRIALGEYKPAWLNTK